MLMRDAGDAMPVWGDASFRDDLAALRSSSADADAEAVAKDGHIAYDDLMSVLADLREHGSDPYLVISPDMMNKLRWLRYGVTPKERARLSTQAPPRRALWRRPI